MLDEIYEKGNFKEAIEEIRILQKPYEEFLKFVKKEKSRFVELSKELEVANLAVIEGFTNNKNSKNIICISKYSQNNIKGSI